MQALMHDHARSDCPIHTALELLGDRWSLLVIRDLMFAGKRHFREFLQSEEGISSNILADRLQSLVANGILSKADDPGHRQKAVYSLTEKGIGLLPVLTALSAWSQQHFAHTRLPDAVALVNGGANSQRKITAALRRQHLG
jgi:DNA-binding HxlR family transcriptional regulator